METVLFFITLFVASFVVSWCVGSMVARNRDYYRPRPYTPPAHYENPPLYERPGGSQRLPTADEIVEAEARRVERKIVREERKQAEWEERHQRIHRPDTPEGAAVAAVWDAELSNLNEGN